MKKNLGMQYALQPNILTVVGTYDDAGTPNAMTVGWAGIANSGPKICVSISVRKETHTYQGLIGRKAFTVNLPSEELFRETAYFGVASGNKENKFAATGLTPVRSDFVDAPYIEEFPVNLECKVIQIHEIGSHIQFIGEIENVKVDDTFDDKTPLIEQLRPIVYGAGDNFTYYGLGKKIRVQQDGISLKESIEKVSQKNQVTEK